MGTQRQIKQLQIQNEINEQFNPFETNIDQVQIQIQEAESQGKDIMSRHLTASNQEKNINLARIDMNNALENTLSRYEGANRTEANQHLMELIGHKTEDKLDPDINNYSLDNLQKVTAFINLVKDRDPDLLLNQDKYNAFLEDKTFTDFDWRI